MKKLKENKEEQLNLGVVSRTLSENETNLIYGGKNEWNENIWIKKK